MMVEASPPEKNDEQYPLLKVETGGGDIGRALPSVNEPGWNITCSKRSWLDRCPELISACWMSGMLLGIFLLILYGLGLGVIRRQPLFMLHCNETKPASEVYYHHIVQHGNAVPFQLFSEYLSNMATLYSSLRFNVIFLIDDSYQSGHHGSSRYSRFLNKLTSIQPYPKLYENNQEIKDFILKYKNVNVTITPLSKYMHTTPLRYKWRTIPMAFLPFYARIFSVWQNGGVGIDLDAFNNQYNRRKLPDRRISEILKQHNDGIKPDEYASTLNKIVRDEQNEFVSIFYAMVNQMLNKTLALINSTLLYSADLTDKDVAPVHPLIRTHRNKRDISEIYSTNVSTINEATKNQNNETENNVLTIVDAGYENGVVNNLTFISDSEVNKKDDLKPSLDFNNLKLNDSYNITTNKNISEDPKVVVIYDFSLVSDNSMGPSYLTPDLMIQPRLPYSEHMNVPTPKKLQYLLSINADGSFIAASSKQHPLLSHIISAGCQRLSPRYAIHDALVSQCSTMFRDDVYCSNIYIL